jgi:hypothetical protein
MDAFFGSCSGGGCGSTREEGYCFDATEEHYVPNIIAEPSLAPVDSGAGDALVCTLLVMWRQAPIFQDLKNK